MNDNNKFHYASKPSTGIWQETASEDNPYVARECRLHGYNILELATKKNFIEVIYLLFVGELPSSVHTAVLNRLMILLLNPGPRNNAVRAAMVAGVGKANSEHLLPIGLNVLGGENGGYKEVEQSWYFLKESLNTSPQHVLSSKVTQKDGLSFPGFGSSYGSVDIMCKDFSTSISQLDFTGQAFLWGKSFVNEAQQHGIGWLNTGMAAAVLMDLGLGARESAGMFQLMCAPGILAHGLEQTHKPITAMPLLEDENYVLKQTNPI